ncbi:hypothetical protein HYC85_022461 [Camellia sinensis]|uniref:Protein kinase domain-containing protein n=1 Tax=Camellia sinensis TaxID=4442 RepID=A0A7J7GPG4_CAMSI|nr:hypothetical protein HYC85_022461 [Camellia sinensis]
MATTAKSTLFLSLTFLFFSLTSASSEPDILLTFKASIKDPMNYLSSWSHTSSSHYCNWTGLTCTTSLPLSVSSLNLQTLNLSGEISSSVCSLPNLQILNLAGNLFNLAIPLHLSQCRSLETLNLSNNLIWGPIPDQISQFGSLKMLDLSGNHVEGKIPESIGALKNLRELNLANNLLSGSVPEVFGNFTELRLLDLSQNSFLDSEIPTGIGNLENLENLLLQSSGFHGSIPESFVGLLGLAILDLSQNNLTGLVPQKLGLSLTNLVSFDVSQNILFGSFPNGICSNAKGLINLSLHTNLFNGSISNNSINECWNLERFQVQNNGFFGDFPNGLWSLPKIKLIRAENNGFSGEIPESISIAAQLEQVQIDNNSFTGTIPQGFGLVRSLYRFSASLNGFYGEIPPNFCDSPAMSIINLSHNSLSGRIPEPRKCGKLVSLSLADNSLVGEIPISLSELPVLTYLDLSNNNLTGPIPLELENLKLALFNVSFNRLSGSVPSSLISGLPASFLQGNPGLCGPGLPNSCSDGEPSPKMVGLSKFACALIFLALAVGILVLVIGVTEHDLMAAMDEKSAIGFGVFGRVHIVKLPSGELVAVKKIVNFGTQSSKALKAEIKTLAKIRHKNIIKILAQILGLQWGDRLRIAIGVAQGLAYLHKDYVPHILHRNVKSNNILLDVDFEPKLMDFGLDRIMGEAAFQSSLASESTFSCYLAPEHGYNKKASEQMDTYSFGVVLFELVTGRKAERTESENSSIDVVKWVRRKINISNGALQVLDPKISRSSQQEMLGAVEIALRCTSVVPEKRPPMAEVVRALQSLDSRTGFPNVEFSASDEFSVPV